MPGTTTTLHAEVLIDGPADATPLVLLHGFTGDTMTWAPFVSELSAARSVVAVDLVGHGRSEAPNDPDAYTMASAVEAVRQAVRRSLGAHELATRLTSGRRAHWLGYSMGGRVALNLAIDAPRDVASLVLIGASPGLADPETRQERIDADEALAAFIEREGLEAFVDRWMAHPLFATQERLGDAYVAGARAQRLRNRPEALAHTLRGMGTGSMEPLWQKMASLVFPVLLVTGGLDQKFDGLAHNMVSLLPLGSRLVVPHVGHAVHVEAPEALAKSVDAFLHRVDLGAGDV